MVTVGGRPPRPCPGSRRAARRSARGRRSRAGGECARPPRKNRPAVASSTVSSSPASATTISPLRVLTPLDDDGISIQDSGVHHRVALDPEEEVSTVGERLGHADLLLDVVLGEQRPAGGDLADEQETPHVGRSRIADRRRSLQLDRPRLRRITPSTPACSSCAR